MDREGAMSGRLGWRWYLLPALVAVVVLLVVAPRALGEGDAPEFTLALALAGVPHPPGYPLYTLLGHGFVVAAHALGASWVFAAVLWSALAAAAATALIAMLCDRVIPEALALEPRARRVLVTGMALLVAFDPVFVRAGTQAEVHALHTAWVAGSLLAGLAWWRARSAAGAGRGLAYGALLGAGLAHHPTALCVALPLAVLAVVRLRREQRPSVRAVAALVVGAIVPMLAYVFVAWRAQHAAAFQWPALEPGLTGWLDHVTGRIYRGYLGGFHPSEAEGRLLWTAIVPLAVPGTIAALAHARRGEDVAAWRAFAAALVLQVAFTLRYGVSDPTAYFLPVLVISAAALTRTIASVASAPHANGPVALMASALAVVVAFTWVVPEYQHARRIEDVDRSVRHALAALPFERGVVLWDSDAYVRLIAEQQLERRKPELIVLDPAMLTWKVERARAARLLGGDPLQGLPAAESADVARVAANIARLTSLPVVDFGTWWMDHASAEATGAPSR